MEFLNKIFGKKLEPTKEKQLEDFYEVELNEKSIIVTHPKRPTEQIDWSDIEEIKLANTDEGPFLPDVWMILMGNGKGCSIPQGSAGWDKVYDIVSKYEGFSFENVIKSASCTDNQIFELWRKK